MINCSLGEGVASSQAETFLKVTIHDTQDGKQMRIEGFSDLASRIYNMCQYFGFS